MRYWGKFMIGAFMGGLLGALVGILIAPESGQNLRKRVTGTIVQIKDEVVHASAEKRTELQEELSRLRKPPSSSEKEN